MMDRIKFITISGNEKTYLCQNGTDYDECTNKVSYKGNYCGDCQEKSFNHFLEDFYGGSNPMTSKERQNESKKYK